MLKPKYVWKLQNNNIVLKNPIDEISKAIGIFDFEKHHNLGTKDFYDPFLFKDMENVKETILKAIKNQDKILIYGDYDVDGITATSILYRVLEQMNANIDYAVPDRFIDGYGLNYNAVNKIINNEIKLLITVDNGITAIEEIEELMKNGIKVIITDHHEPKDILPKANYILHPALEKDYPFSHLSGVGVAFKLACALNKEIAYKYLDLVMLGTIADMVPFEDENQAIINSGLKIINRSQVLGLKKVLDFYHLNPKTISDISYSLAPKINSMGRMGKANVAIDLLITNDPVIIYETVDILDDIDQERKGITKDNIDKALKMVNPNDFVNIVYDSSFHEGVLGIVAQKLVQETYKVSGVFYIDEGVCKGSFRSVPGVNILSLLDSCKDLIIRYGGHEMAAGIQIEEENLIVLKEKLNEMLKDQVIEKELNIVANLDKSLINVNFYEDLVKFSLENKYYLFENLEIIRKTILLDKHTKFSVKANNMYFDVLSFNDKALYYSSSPGDFINVVGNLNLNVWNNQKNVQLIIKDIEIKDFQVIDLRNVEDYNNGRDFLNKQSFIIDENLLSIEEMEKEIKRLKPMTIYLGYNPSYNLSNYLSLNFLRETYKYIIQKIMISKDSLYKALKIPYEIGEVIIDIFKDIKIISLEESQIRYEKTDSVELNDSITYAQMKKKIDLINLLNFKKKDELKKYFIDLMEE